MQRTRDLAEGRIPRALPGPRPDDFPASVYSPLGRAELSPDDFVVTELRSGRERPIAAVRLENDPLLGGRARQIREQQRRDAFRRRLALEDELSGAAARRAEMRQDDAVDEFVSNLLGQYRRDVFPDLPENTVAPRMRGVERFIVNEALDPMSKGALGEPIPISESVRSMIHRGYALPGMNMSVLQGRDRGKFMPMTLAEREFKRAVQTSPEADQIIARALRRLREQ